MKKWVLAAFVLGYSPTVWATCGDGEYDSSTEDCDDGNSTDGDGCDSTCAVELGWECVEAKAEVDFAETLMGSTGPNWTVSTDGRTISQTRNSDPGVYMTFLPATGVEVSFDVKVGTSSDDDFIGFVIAYEQGDNAASSSDWLLYDWKQGTQSYTGCTADKGTALSRVTGAVNTDYGELWCHKGDVAEIARGTTYGSTGWSDNTTHTVDISYSTTQIDIWVDGNLDISQAGSFPAGNFGFYTFSQEKNTFTLVDPAAGLSVCGELDSDGDGVTDPNENPDSSTSLDDDDTDGDGIPDYLDTDDDGDGIPTNEEIYDGEVDATLQDSDGDGIPDFQDDDDDGDGQLTADEDLDGDGDPRNDDYDEDGVYDYLDPDDDNGWDEPRVG